MKLVKKFSGIILIASQLVSWNCAKKDAVQTHPISLPNGYENRYYQGMRYGLFIPPSYDPTQSYPFIISLHGSTDTVSWDLSWYHDPIQATDPCFVITPKSLVANNGWGNSWMSTYSTDLRKTMDVVDSLMTEFNIDTTRLYIYGTSMGGFGVYSALANEPGRFAGAFSICGGGNPEKASRIMQTPLWIFHGSDDPVVPVGYSRDMYQAILQAGGTQVRYTEYPGVGHAAWTPAWQELTLESWLLAQQKGIVHSWPDTLKNFSCEIIYTDQVKISWNPPSNQTNPDNQIWYCRIFRDSQLIGEVDNVVTTYIDSTVVSSSTHLYNAASVNYFFKESRRTIPKSVRIGS